MSRGARGPTSRLLGEKLGRLAEGIALIAVPAGAALALLATATESAHRIDSDLRLIAPDYALAGERLPIRAQFYTQLARPEGARLVRAQVDLTLRDRSGRAIAQARLRPSFADTLDGALLLPLGTVAPVVLQARVRIGRESAVAEREVLIGASALGWHARSLPPLQRMAMLPVRVERGDAASPDALELRVGQGACVPEQPCELFVHVGSPAASVRLEASRSATPDPASALPAPATSGVVRMRVTTHGPEAQLAVLAERDGVVVASRRVRLPVALGASVLHSPPRVLDAPAVFALALRGDERGCIVDAFRDQRWLRTGSLRGCHGQEGLPFAPLTAGLWQLQVRRDPFAAESAAVFALYVRAPGESAAAVLARLAEAALEREPRDRLAGAVQRAPALYVGDFDATAGYLLAALDQGIADLPAAVSSFPGALAQAQVEHAKLRRLCLYVLVLCALTLGLSVAQRGLRAAVVANRVMRAAGEAPKQLERQRARMLLRVLAVVTSLLLVFAAIALYTVVRSRGW